MEFQFRIGPFVFHHLMAMLRQELRLGIHDIRLAPLSEPTIMIMNDKYTHCFRYYSIRSSNYDVS